MATAPVAKVVTKVIAPVTQIIPAIEPDILPVDAIEPDEILESYTEVQEPDIFVDPEEIHKDWLVDSVAEGWAYGAEYDVDAKTSPWIRNYKALSASEKLAFLAR